MEQLLTPRDAAKILKVSVRTIYREGERGNLKKIRVGSRLRFRMEDIQKYIADAEEAPPQPKQLDNIARFKYVPGMKVV